MIGESKSHRLLNQGFSRLRLALEKYELLPRHSRALIAVSGGVDSLVLLYLLTRYNQKFDQDWDLHAVHVDPQFPGWDTGRLEAFFKAHCVPYRIVKSRICKKIARLEKKCFFCARERRRRLLERAAALNIFNVALAHHQRDVVETMLLNLIYTGQVAAFVPKQSVIRGRFFFIRPLYFFDKKLIAQIARAHDLPADINNCPYGSDNKREKIREFLQRVQREYPDVYRGMFNALFNVNRTYLP